MTSLVLQLQAQDDTNRERPQEKGCKVSVGISQVSDDCRGSSGTYQVSRTRQRGFCTFLQCLGHIVHMCVFKRPFLMLQVPPRFLVNSPVIWHALLKMKSVLSPREASRREGSQLHTQTEGCATRSRFRQGVPLWLRGAERLQGWNRPKSSRPWGQA